MSVMTELHRKVLFLLNDERPGRVLDAPSGTGLLSMQLKERGFSVLASDKNKSFFEQQDIDFQEADLNKNLPFENNCFDYATCVEGIEHLEDPHHLIREFHRVLKVGGKLIITTPNIINVSSRLRYFLIGYFDFFGGYFADPENIYVYHINPVGFPELYQILQNNGFTVEEISANRDAVEARKFMLRIILRICLVFIKLLSRWKIRDAFLRKVLISRKNLGNTQKNTWQKT